MSDTGTKMMLFPITVFVLSMTIYYLMGSSPESVSYDEKWFIKLALLSGVGLLASVAAVMGLVILSGTEWFGIFSLGGFTPFLMFKAAILLSALIVGAFASAPVFTAGGVIGKLIFALLILMGVIGFGFHVGAEGGV